MIFRSGSEISAQIWAILGPNLTQNWVFRLRSLHIPIRFVLNCIFWWISMIFNCYWWYLRVTHKFWPNDYGFLGPNLYHNLGFSCLYLDIELCVAYILISIIDSCIQQYCSLSNISQVLKNFYILYRWVQFKCPLVQFQFHIFWLILTYPFMGCCLKNNQNRNFYNIK